MTLSSHLLAILTEDAVVPSKGGNIVLQESDANSSMKVEVVKPPASGVTIDVDKLSHSPAIKDTRGFKLKCDYLLLFESNGETVLFSSS